MPFSTPILSADTGWLGLLPYVLVPLLLLALIWFWLRRRGKSRDKKVVDETLDELAQSEGGAAPTFDTVSDGDAEDGAFVFEENELAEADSGEVLDFGNDDPAEMDSDEVFVFEEDDNVVEVEPEELVAMADATDAPTKSRPRGEEAFSRIDVLDALNDTAVGKNSADSGSFGEAIEAGMAQAGNEFDPTSISSGEVFSNTDVIGKLNDTSSLESRMADAEGLVEDSGELDLSSIAAGTAAAGVAALGAAFAFGGDDNEPDESPAQANFSATPSAESSAREASLKAKVAALESELAEVKTSARDSDAKSAKAAGYQKQIEDAESKMGSMQTELESLRSEVKASSDEAKASNEACLLYTSPSPRDLSTSRMPSSA